MELTSRTATSKRIERVGSMYKISQAVRTIAAHHQTRVREGDQGTVVEVFRGGETYLVQFVGPKGEIMAVLELKEAQLVPVPMAE